MSYDALLHDMIEEARGQDDIVGALLTGSLARGDALPGTDLDLRFILADGLSRPFRSELRNGILVERGYADAPAARATIETHPMHVYAYLDGRILYDPCGALVELRRQAQRRFDTYRTSAPERATIAHLLGCARDKISVAMRGGDVLKAAFVTATCSWQIIEGLWAANDRPLPPNSSVRPHLRDLTQGPPEVETLYHQMFLGETEQRVRVALDLIEWIQGRLAPTVG